MKSTPIIYVFKEDARPYFQVRVVDAQTGLAIDLSNTSYTARMLFRQVGSTTTLADIPMTKVGDGVAGQLYHIWVDDDSNDVLGLSTVEAGQRYEGQVIIDFNGSDQTVNTKVRISVKERYAEVA